MKYFIVTVILVLLASFSWVGLANAGNFNTNKANTEIENNSRSNSDAHSSAHAHSNSRSKALSLAGVHFNSEIDVDPTMTNRQFQSQDDFEVEIEIEKNTVNSVGLPEESARQLRKAAERHAETAGDARSASASDRSPCGDSTGLSGQTGVAGGGLATITETCRAWRLQVLAAESTREDGSMPLTTHLAKVTHIVGWFPRMVLHVATLGVLN